VVKSKSFAPICFFVGVSLLATLIVPTLRVGMHPVTLCVTRGGEFWTG
jgi:hypothetical protein